MRLRRKFWRQWKPLLAVSSVRETNVVMGFSDFLGNERIVNALRGALRAERVPHALLFTGASGVGKYTLGADVCAGGDVRADEG